MRICSFFSSATELLSALGLSRSVVGRSEHCDYPPSVRRAPIVVRSRIASSRLSSRDIHEAVQSLRQRGEHQYDIDTALLKRLHPDVVVTQELCNVCAASHPEVLDAIRQLPHQPRVVSVTARRLDELFGCLEQLGQATGRADRAKSLNTRLRRDLEALERRVRHAKQRPRVWCAEWLDPLMAAGHWIPEMVRLAGGQDGLGKPGEDSSRITWDDVLRYDPEVILAMPCSFSMARTAREFPLLENHPRWNAVSAVKAKRVYAINTAFFHRQGPRLITGLRIMASLFHPALFPKPPHAHATVLG
ncbi:MAG: cobalamin-binding protein [Candidatus Omnitrophica bacterium]|nr:cobalamin-binding protein [Candidatus Omnitrophota bacterium]